MATATVKLYYGTAQKPWLLTANKFFVIDNLTDYLSTFTPTTISNFQYQKCTLELSINCDLSQTYSEPLYANGIKYVSIQNSDASKIYYYYVKRAEWRGKQTVKLYLVMDVANTFRGGIDFDFTEKTKIIREHKDRVKSARERYYYFQMEDIELTAPTTVSGNQINWQINYTDDSGDPYDEEQEEYYDIHGVSGVSVPYIYDDTEHRVLIPFTDFNPVPTSYNFGVIEGDYPSVECTITLSSKFKGHHLYLNIYGFYNKTIYGSEIRTYRLIDLQSEGLSPLLYKKEEETINRSGLLNVDWYLLYRNQNDPTEALTNPVECYLLPSSDIPTNLGSIQTGGRIKPENLEYNKYYYIHILKEARYQSEVKSVILSDGTNYTTHVGSSTNRYEYYYFIIYKASDNKITVITRVYYTEYGQPDTNYLLAVKTVDYFQVSPLPFTYYLSTTFSAEGTIPADASTLTWSSSGLSPFTLDGINKLDRTDAKNIKLIKLPYIPYDFEVEGNKMIITDTDFEHVSLTQSGGGVIEVLKLKNLNIKLNYTFLRGGSPLGNLTCNINKNIILNNFLTYPRYDRLESKLYHSDYYQEKFVYDSFGYVFMLERMDLSHYIYNLNETSKLNLTVRYVVSTTITSKFMFQFPDYKSKNGKEDYDNVMPIARNNEVVLYNVPYINYIRTGFNYDVKNKQTQMASSWISVGLSAASTVVSLALPSVPLKVAGVVASLVSTALSVKNAVVSQVQAERNIDEKMMAAKNQQTSVSGSDDVDLMSVYTGNRAKMCTYQCNDVIKELLADLFFYTGYVSNKMGLPDVNSRLNFNYLEADIIINDYVNMSDEIMNELVGLYKNGLTFIHKVASRSTEPWDLEQKYENFEKSLIYL